MSSRYDDALRYVRATVAQLGAEFGLPLADWTHEELGAHFVLSESFPYLISWPGSDVAVNIPIEVWRRRRRLTGQTRKFRPWPVALF